ncbi:formate dehydrogenase subunit gamma [Belnapia sp. T6]|uniref:Formate dehydrogenase subunit gamma n=1 Tax=Belnapia mucosa TaxID=2804532 RepID=A0ABS1V611_9PROT|nr:formate dehydrogenase subunit gamma [Belnapia mucosa]MBL6456727.1 formate dehydrogenase subunit gamma [Belnapia mucosa]
MKPVILGAALALALLAGPVAAQQAGGAPEVQAPVPEVGAGRGGVGAGQVPATTEPQRPTGQPAAPQPAVAPRPAAPIIAPAPLGDRGQPDAAELELQAALRGERIAGRISIPDPKAANLIQPEGRDWRAFHNRTLAWIGGIAVLGMLGILALFYLIRGRIRPEEGMSGVTIPRFTLLERANHWMVASCFIILGLSGLNLTFGRHLLLPLIGPEGFTAVSMAGKIAHNYLAFPFTLGLVVMLLLWVRDNIPNRLDLDWLRAGGGFIGRGHPKSGRFNAGQKLVFWITVLGGALVAASGYVLIFPFTVVDIAGQQSAHMIHGVLAVLMVAAMLAHIYIGSLGMVGAFDAMGSGQVDVNWAREHHALWVEQELARTRQAAAPGGARAAGAD